MAKIVLVFFLGQVQVTPRSRSQTTLTWFDHLPPDDMVEEIPLLL